MNTFRIKDRVKIIDLKQVEGFSKKFFKPELIIERNTSSNPELHCLRENHLYADCLIAIQDDIKAKLQSGKMDWSELPFTPCMGFDRANPKFDYCRVSILKSNLKLI